MMNTRHPVLIRRLESASLCAKLHAGLATAAATAGKSEWSMMKQTVHRSVIVSIATEGCFPMG
jgi:hypothetical protein